MTEKGGNNGSREAKERKARSILELSAPEAREFLLKSESFCSMELPPYFVFTDLLSSVSEKIENKDPKSFYHAQKLREKSCDELNHTIFSNKDGRYAWRPLQLVNPFLYVSLAHGITEDSCWGIIRERFQCFSENGQIECTSHPVESLTEQKDKAQQISTWWEKLEQRSISLALEYEHLVCTDISDCYGSIYTHSIAWALHGKETARKKRTCETMIGNVIDRHIQNMRGGQTNGIPQGSVLMDFVAEVVLGYADLKLSERISEQKIRDYRILRYRDDYRIFTNNPKDGEQILKLLTEGLIDLGMRTNSAKTLATDDVIRQSIKPDKLFWIGQRRRERNFQKQLLIIHDLAARFPNSGSLVRALNDYHERVPPSGKRSAMGDKKATERMKKAAPQLISIITDIAYRNPKVYKISSAILSKFIHIVDDDAEKSEMVSRVERRLGQIPNIGHLQIWLQRITVKFERERLYEEKLCELVRNGSDNGDIWDFSWLKGKHFGEGLRQIKVIDEEKMEKLPPFVGKEEVELFKSDYYD